MITLENAKAIALERNNLFDTFQEYSDAYVFYINDGEITDGGAGRNCVIEKKTGRVIPWAIYFLTGKYQAVEIGEPKKIN